MPAPFLAAGFRRAEVARLTASLSLLLSACAEPASLSPGEQHETFKTTATAQERRAAQALSLSGGSGPNTTDPYAAAVECEAALAMIADRFAESGLVNAAQRQSLTAAREAFRNRAAQAATAQGIGAADLALAMEDAGRAARRKGAESARTGLSCLKSLG